MFNHAISVILTLFASHKPQVQSLHTSQAENSSIYEFVMVNYACSIDYIVSLRCTNRSNTAEAITIPFHAEPKKEPEPSMERLAYAGVSSNKPGDPRTATIKQLHKTLSRRSFNLSVISKLAM